MDSPPGTALVVYESMFGNTVAVAAAVAAGLRAGGVHTVVRHAAEAIRLVDVSTDLLVVGGPTHGFTLSTPGSRADAVRQGAPAEVCGRGVREWLDEACPEIGHGRVAVAFDTRVAKVRRWPLSAGRKATRLLRRCGFDEVLVPHAFLVSGLKGDLLDGQLEEAQGWGQDLAARVFSRREMEPTTPASSRSAGQIGS